MRKQAKVRQADVLNILAGRDKPMTAYEILGLMKDDEPQLAPQTVYRALGALTEQGRAHRLESLNAFIACRCDHDSSVPVLAICDECGSVEEHDGAALLPAVSDVIGATGFAVRQHIVEVRGQCGTCAA
ncbi:MAG: Fur family transcriptional regulator [Pseudomonadota bacterium]